MTTPLQPARSRVEVSSPRLANCSHYYLLSICFRIIRREYDRLAAGSSPKKQDRNLIEAKKDIYEHLLKILQEEENLLKKQKAIMEKIATGKIVYLHFQPDNCPTKEKIMLYTATRSFLTN